MKISSTVFLFVTALAGGATPVPVPPDVLTVVAVLQDDTALAGAHDIAVRDGLAYIAGKGGSLAIVDVKQPTAPRLLWSAQDPLAYEDAQTVLLLDGHRLLVGARELLLFDTRQPNSPILVATIKDRPRIDRLNGFARFGDTIYGVNKGGFIIAAEVGTPDGFRLIGTRATRERDRLVAPHGVALSGEHLVVVDGAGFGRGGSSGQIGIYRVIDPVTRAPLPPEQWSAPVIIADLRFAGANRVMTRGAFAFVGSSLAPESPRNAGLQNNVSIVDLSDPTRPRLRGTIAFPEGRGPNGLAVSGDIVFAAGGQTVQAIDVSHPDHPRELAHVTAPAGFPGGVDDAHDLAYHDGHLFITAQTSHALVIVRVEGKALLAAARR